MGSVLENDFQTRGPVLRLGQARGPSAAARTGGILLENDFWTTPPGPPLLSVLHMDLTESVST